ALRAISREDKLIYAECLKYPEFLGQFDCVFFDPMFQKPSDKTAPKKAMQVFRQWVGPDVDAIDVAKKLQKHSRRLVVKRANKASQILPNASMSFTGKSTTYDVYLQ